MGQPEHSVDTYHSFLIRMWRRDAHGEQTQVWEGELHHLQGDRVYVFHSLGQLVDYLLYIVLSDKEVSQ